MTDVIEVQVPAAVQVIEVEVPGPQGPAGADGAPGSLSPEAAAASAAAVAAGETATTAAGIATDAADIADTKAAEADARASAAVTAAATAQAAAAAALGSDAGVARKQSVNDLGTTSGTSTAYTVALPTGVSVASGLVVSFTPHVLSGAAPTLKIGDAAAAEIRDAAGNALADGALAASVTLYARYNGTVFRLQRAPFATNSQIDALSAINAPVHPAGLGRALEPVRRQALNDVGTTAGTSTAYTATLPSGVTVATGLYIRFTPHALSGAAPTLALSGGAAVEIRDAGGNALADGALPSGVTQEARYNGTVWRISRAPFATNSQMDALTADNVSVTPLKLERALIPVRRRGINYASSVAGTATSYTATLNPTITSLNTNQVVAFVPHVTSGASPTLAIDGLTAAEIRNTDVTALPAGALPAGEICVLLYVSPYWRLLFRPGLAAQVAALAAQISNLGGDGVADVYDESTTVGTAATVIIEPDQPIGSLSIQNRSPDATVTLDLGGAAFTLPPLAALDQKGLPPTRIRASASAAGAPLSVLVGNNAKVSPNAPRRATALLRAMDTAAGAKVGAAYEKAIRDLYYEWDRLGLFRISGALHVAANESQGAALVDWVSLTSATASGPTFTAKQGLVFDGVDDYVTSGWRMSDVPGATAHYGAVACWTSQSAAAAGKYAMGDGIWGITPYGSGTTWRIRPSQDTADLVTVPSGANTGGIIGWREDDFSIFGAFEDQEPQRFERDGRETLLTAPFLYGAMGSSGGTPTTNTYWAGTLRAVWFGLPPGIPRWRAMNAAMKKFFAAVEAIS